MGVLLQLMALPAACMLFAWTRRGGGNPVALALRRMVALLAVHDIMRERIAGGGAPASTRSAGKVVRLAVSPGAAHRTMAKAGRLSRNASPPRVAAIDDPQLRMRRIRLRWAAGNP
jgi:hypothetical protein